MRVRWSLKAFIVLITLVCLALSRVAHVRNKHLTLTNQGAQLAFTWENPTLSTSDRIYGDWIGDLRVARRDIQHKLTTAPANRSLFAKLKSSIICDEVKALSIPMSAMNSKSTIDSLKELSGLNFIVLRGAIENRRLTDPELAIVRMALPNVAVYADIYR